MGLTIVATLQAHGHAPSASELVRLVKTIRKEQAGAIFTEPQYPSKAGEALGREARIPVAILDPVANGPANAPLDYYETTMRKNLQILKATLGVR
jgi:ABC-type Zn uptake system ZnuABC Zn-binding protein ZnuA